ncbi:hypothetical protein RJ639_041911 [Escallonia herrerae]|uniref:Pectinesterase inhibitor domain-containing protein n=1 Tax=Escallonia herrerae TaxID=1293975 RepID=A0AA89B354_9ASTE|nr:hypothetical protein RJ639_041911 [Escallonia herrerae]
MKLHHPPSLPFLLLATVLIHLSAITFSTAAATVPTANNTDFIRASCGTTLYPELCYTSLSGYANVVRQDPARLARVAIGVSLSKARLMASYVSNLSRQADYGSDHRAASVLHDCHTVFGDAIDGITGSLQQMRQLGGSPEALRFQVSNVQTYLSAALTNEDTCTDGFDDVPDCPVKSDVSGRVVKVKKVTSNALALVNSYASKVTNP